MTKPSIGIIVGSLRRDSYNLKLAKALMELGASDFHGYLISIGELPLFSQDLEGDFPKAATSMKHSIEKADGILFITPEYNRSIPAPLKNALDWASRPYGKNSFAGKPGAICGASVSNVGTACAQQALTHVLHYLDLALMGQPEVYLQVKGNWIDDEGRIEDPSTAEFLQKFVKKFTTWVHQHR